MYNQTIKTTRDEDMSNKTIAEALIKAQQFEDEDKFEQAYECYKYALNINPNGTDVLQKAATAAQMLQNNVDAVNYWNQYMQLKPEDPLSYNQLLDLYFHDNKYEYYMTRAKLKTIEGRLPQATDDYKKAISNTSEDKEIIASRYLLAQTYEIINKPLQAIDEYLKILDHDKNEAVYLSLANLYYTEDKSAALDILQQAVKDYPDSEAIKESLCKIYLALGDYEKAETYAVSIFNKIKAMLMQEKNEAAFNLLEDLSNKDKQDISYPALMAEYYYNVDDNDNALIWIDSLEKRNPDSPLPSQMRALVFEKTNDDFNAHFNWGKYYIKKGQYDLALDEYLNAYNENSQNTEIIKELINLYSVLDDKFACAEFCEKLVAIEKEDIATIKRLIKFYEEQGYEDKVMEYLFALAEINTKDYATFLQLAKHAEKNRRIDEAIEYYQKYLKFAPNSDEKEEIKKKVDLLATGEMGQDEGFLDKILGFFSKK